VKPSNAGDIGGTLADGHPRSRQSRRHGGLRPSSDPGVIRLIRNQEDRAAPGQESVGGPAETRYDPLGGGGNVTLDYDERRHRFVQDYIEDDAGSQDGDTHPLAPGITDVNRLIGISLDGEAFEFAVNRLNDSELAGACFSPSGRMLFVNIFGNGSPGSGMTLAIAGPWSAGPL
jgi:hypothetical protein